MTNIVIVQKTNRRWFGEGVEPKTGARIKVEGPTFTGFSTKKECADVVRMLGYRPVDDES